MWFVPLMIEAAMLRVLSLHQKVCSLGAFKIFSSMF
jgi:hypothetical protein